MPQTPRQESLSPKNTLLAHHIAAHFRAGIQLDAATLTFIESTLGVGSGADLVSLLNDSDDSQRDSLLALIFSPDKSLQLAVEPLLVQTRFVEVDQADIAARLTESLPAVTIVMPQQEGRLTLPAPSWAWARLVEGLNITWRLPSRIDQAIVAHIPPTEQEKARVTLRNMAFSSSAEGIAACAHLMAAYPHVKARFPAVLDFLGNFLCRLPLDSNPYTELMELRRHYQRGYHQAQRFEILRATHNIETLMLQGVSAPAMGTDQARRMLIMIDDIALMLFDRTAPIEEGF